MPTQTGKWIIRKIQGLKKKKRLFVAKFLNAKSDSEINKMSQHMCATLLLCLSPLLTWQQQWGGSPVATTTAFFLQGCHLHLNCKVKKQWWGLHFTLSAFGPDCRPTCKNASWCNPRNTHCRLPQSHTKFDYSKKKTLLLCFWRHSLGLPVTFQSNAKANNSGWLFHSGGATHNLCIYPGHSATLPLSHCHMWPFDMWQC